ncbi:hypothetical protein H8K35_16680 [Undibacterium sp. LX40W]|uniref:Uncharacterized protein n=1 Tax=Undibacterium nitidum TaxID=2762298 RepID=A0A923KUT3_9BURK|nr:MULTISPECIES: hypothetical protein [Undibacterium]MBC3883034.1 hypothetical protein [Undibacterium nitidum]MBC3893315.1 hypothetical protein [Undibacterium sp. LX40W]
MKSSTSEYLYSVLRQAWQELRALGGKAAQMLMRTPLPKLLVLCIGLALIITIVPLILTLFVAFMLIKLLLLLVFVSVRANKTRHDSSPNRPHYSSNDVEDVQVIRVEKIDFRRGDRR